MEQRDWNVFRHRSCEETSKDRKIYCQEYLQPCLYLDIFVEFTDHDLILDCYNRCLQQFGDAYVYYGWDNGKQKRIRDRDKIYGQLSEFFSSKKLIFQQSLSSRGDVGISDDLGGVGDVSFECSLFNRPETEKIKLQRVQNIERSQAKYQQANGEEVWYEGLLLSVINICIPVNTFSTADAFLDWVKSFKLLSQGRFFSSSAGYKLASWWGYTKTEAIEKINAILREHPGMHYRSGGRIGNRFVPEQNDYVPQLHRINWLNIISTEALPFLGGAQQFANAASSYSNLKLHDLSHGWMIQAGEQPGIGSAGHAPPAYYEAARLLEPILFVDQRKHCYYDLEEEKNWLFHFHPANP